MASAQKERKQFIEKQLEEYVRTGQRRTYDIKFKGHRYSLEVISVRTSQLVLNHNNNRLNAQIQGHPANKKIMSEPESEFSQNIIHELLSQTDRFEELKNQIHEYGQKDPGLITREGLLVNGNTRMAAIMDLANEGKGDGIIDVAVLQPNLDSFDIVEIEMVLQMSNFVHQDYTFTNELIMMRNFTEAGGSDKELAKYRSWARKGVEKVQQRRRILNIIEEVRSMSDPTIPYSSFDKKKQHFIDLDESMQSLQQRGEHDNSEALKLARITSIFLGLNKDRVRKVDENFIFDLIEDRDEHGAPLKSFIDKTQSTSTGQSIDQLFGEDKELKSIQARKIAEYVLRSTDLRNEDGSIVVDKDKLGELSEAAKVFTLKAQDLITDDLKKNLALDPPETLKEQRKQIEKISDFILEVSKSDHFDKGKFGYQLGKLEDSISKIRKIFDSLK